MAGNGWANCYLEAILDVWPGLDDAKASLLLRDRGHNQSSLRRSSLASMKSISIDLGIEYVILIFRSLLGCLPEYEEVFFNATSISQ